MQAGEHGVEQALMVAAFDADLDDAADEWCRRGGVDAGTDDLLQPFLDLLVVEHFERALQEVGDRIAGAGGVGRAAEPGAEPLADVGLSEPLGEHLLGQEVALDELAEAATDLVLAVGDDRRVRDRDARADSGTAP